MAEPTTTRMWEVERTYVYSTPADGPVTILFPPALKAPESIQINALTYMLDTEATFKLRAWVRNKSEWAARQHPAD